MARHLLKKDEVTFNLYMLNAIQFLKTNITKKEFLASAAEALEEATDTKDESYLKVVCFTQARAVVLRELAEEVHLKMNFI
jgi:predicted membrane-bound mannosyltransferase